MATIEIPDEMHVKLLALSTEIATQSNRGTAMPYIFQVQETKKIYHVSDGEDGYTWVSEDCEEVGEKRKNWVQWLRDEGNKISNKLSDEQVEDMLEQKGCHKVYYKYDQPLSNAFLTAKATKEHIEANKHHYENPRDYLNFAFRNPELELVFELLMHLTGNKLIK